MWKHLRVSTKLNGDYTLLRWIKTIYTVQSMRCTDAKVGSLRIQRCPKKAECDGKSFRHNSSTSITNDSYKMNLMSLFKQRRLFKSSCYIIHTNLTLVRMAIRLKECYRLAYLGCSRMAHSKLWGRLKMVFAWDCKIGLVVYIRLLYRMR